VTAKELGRMEEKYY
jgi:hypothetical protein